MVSIKYGGLTVTCKGGSFQNSGKFRENAHGESIRLGLSFFLYFPKTKPTTGYSAEQDIELCGL